MLTYNKSIYVWQKDDRKPAVNAGFQVSPTGIWFTADPFIAYQVFHLGADGKAKAALGPLANAIEASGQQFHPTAEPPVPQGRELLPYQKAGINHLADQLIMGKRAVLCGDEQGLGKTCQAIGVANVMRWSRILVICPASLCINWQREIDAWHLWNAGVVVARDGKSRPIQGRSFVTSYALAGASIHAKFDVVIVDEAHYVKNADSKRTKAVLGYKKNPGLIGFMPTIYLTGTPIPNRPHEIWPILYRSAPECINNMKLGAFTSRFCVVQEAKVVGAQKTRELYTRLRGSGFLLRRLKADVLKDLPPKRYKMVVFPADGAMRKVLKKEAEFDAKEIAVHGAPVGTVLPEVRREMGLAKAPAAIEYIMDLLDGGIQKVIVFCHHTEVAKTLSVGLEEYGVGVIVGVTPMAKRQAIVDEFQRMVGAIRIIVANEAGSVGWTMTAAHEVVDVEPEWTPGLNDQRYDRAHRIGQTERVTIHQLVVEGSLDAVILGSAARKKTDTRKVLDGKS